MNNTDTPVRIGPNSQWDTVLGGSGDTYYTDAAGVVYTMDAAGNYQVVGTLQQLSNALGGTTTSSAATSFSPAMLAAGAALLYFVMKG